MITITANAPEVRVQLEAKGPRVFQFLSARMNDQAVRLQAHVVGSKLSGQVLQHRSGKLAGSVRVLPSSPTSLAAEVQAGGGPAWYGRIHEYGGVFTYLRKNKNRAFGTNVTAHFPERSFMRTSLNDRRSQIINALSAALQEGLS